MSSVDDILFEPINTSSGKLLIDTQMIDAVKIALTGVSALEFLVDPDISVDTYDMIADLVENDLQVTKYTGQMVPAILSPADRPSGALSIKDVFRRLHNGDEEFYFCARANGGGVLKFKFTNYFAIDSRVPIVHVEDQSGSGGGGFFEWWIVGLMSRYVGYNEYYAFATEADARKYYAVP